MRQGIPFKATQHIIIYLFMAKKIVGKKVPTNDKFMTKYLSHINRQNGKNTGKTSHRLQVYSIISNTTDA